MATVSDRLFEAKSDMQLITQRAITRHQKLDTVRMSLIEEHQDMIAKAIMLLLEMKEKGL